MKTVNDAVIQEDGVWCYDESNVMAYIFGDINYMKLVSGILMNSDGDVASKDWQLVCTREEFEKEAIRLINKPDWKDAPDWARWLGQTKSGNWEWYEKKPLPDYVKGYWCHCPFNGELATNGTVLGYWINTLEQRPASSELNQSATKKEYRFKHHDSKDWCEWDKCTIIYESDYGCVVREEWGAEVFFSFEHYDVEFRPVTLDRDQWIDLAKSKGFKSGMAARMHDVLVAGELPLPNQD